MSSAPDLYCNMLIFGWISLLSKLDKKQQEVLLSDTANPFPGDWFAAPSSATNAAAKSTSSKPSIKEAIAQQRLQKKTSSDRPGSAAEIATPARDISAQVPARYILYFTLPST